MDKSVFDFSFIAINVIGRRASFGTSLNGAIRGVGQLTHVQCGKCHAGATSRTAIAELDQRSEVLARGTSGGMLKGLCGGFH